LGEVCPRGIAAEKSLFNSLLDGLYDPVLVQKVDFMFRRVDVDVNVGGRNFNA
jgi:hypothetical protein